MYTPSPEGEAIRARLRLVHEADPGLDVTAGIPELYLRIGGYTVSLRIGDSCLRQALAQRFESCPAVSGTVALGLTVLDYLTEDTDLLLLSPFRTVMAKRSGMLYFGIQDRETLRILAGSLGGGGSTATETDFVECLIEAEIMTAMARIAPELDFVHAASISRSGSTVLLVGPPESGKSTLSAAATLCGYELLGDDVACIDLIRRVAYSYPRKPRLRTAALKMLAHMGGVPGNVTMGREHPIAAVCFLGGFASQPSLAPLGGMKAVWSMSRHIFHAGRPVAPIVARLAEHLPNLPCYELRAGSLKETLPALDTVTGRTRTVGGPP